MGGVVGREANRIARPLVRHCLPALVAAMLLTLSPCGAQQELPAETIAAEGAPAEAAPPESPASAATSQGDSVAALFLSRCAGCHTVGGGTRTGPDLLPSSTQGRESLFAAIKRMEKNAGPMADDEIEGLVAFLKDTNVRDRIAAEESRRALVATAALEPASASEGRALFRGEQPLRNGGPKCSACHAANGEGGTLAVDLTTVHDRFGTAGLSSAIGKAAFPVMKPIYDARPITGQEAAHLAAYFEQARARESISAPFPVAALGAAVGGAMLGALVVAGIRRRPGTRARLVNQANRS